MLPAVPRHSPVFTSVLVHGWYIWSQSRRPRRVSCADLSTVEFGDTVLDGYRIGT